MAIKTIDPKKLFPALAFKPMQGQLMSQWTSRLKMKTIKTVDTALRLAWTDGLPIEAAARSLRPTLDQSTQSLQSIARTFFGQLAADSRTAVWKANDDLLEGVTWESILDSRTTVDICGVRDQKKYTVDGEPIEHSLPWGAGPGLMHWQCRSHAFPIIKGVKRQVERQAIGPGSEYKKGDNLTASGKVQKNRLPAREKGIIASKTAPIGQDYEKWLLSQKETPAGRAFLKDVLGQKRGQAFIDGKYKLGGKFTPGGKGGGGLIPPKKPPLVTPVKVKPPVKVKVKPPVKVKVKPPVKVQPPVKFGKHGSEGWSKQAFPDAPEPIRRMAYQRHQHWMGLKLEDSAVSGVNGASAYYRGIPTSGMASIGMPKLTASSILRHLQGVWRHEMGHAVDHMLGLAPKPAHLSAAASSAGSPNVFHVGKEVYRSGWPDFVEARKSDVKKLVASFKDQSMFGSKKIYSDFTNELLQAPDDAARKVIVDRIGKKVGVSYDDLFDLTRTETNSVGFTHSPYMFSNANRVGKMLHALDLKDAETFYSNFASYDKGSMLASENFARGNAGFFADLIGATTKNHVLDANQYPGHSTEYYEKWTGAAPTEIFANMTALYGSDKPVWIDIIRKFVPKTAKVYEGVMGL